MRYDLLKFQLKIQESLNLIAEWMQKILIIFLHIMTRFYLKVQMKSVEDFKCGWIILNVDIKKGENSQLFGEITIKVSPPIYISEWYNSLWNHLFWQSCFVQRCYDCTPRRIWMEWSLTSIPGSRWIETRDRYWDKEKIKCRTLGIISCFLLMWLT